MNKKLLSDCDLYKCKDCKNYIVAEFKRGGGKNPLIMGHCPVCKKEVISDWNRDLANDYCHNCGQALDWSE